MAFRKGVQFRPAKAKAASLFARQTGAPNMHTSGVKSPETLLVPEEEVSQESAVWWFRYYGLPYDADILYTPTGIPVRGATEAERQKLFLMNQALERRGMRRGMPDTVTPYQGIAHWIELKREGSTYSAVKPHQRRELLRLLKCGCRVGIARSRHEMEWLYLGWGIPLRNRLEAGPAMPVQTAGGQIWPLEGEALRQMILSRTNEALLRHWGYEPIEPQNQKGATPRPRRPNP